MYWASGRFHGEDAEPVSTPFEDYDGRGAHSPTSNPPDDSNHDFMDRSQRILLSVWREACRHIEIGESATRIAELLEHHMPVARFVVQRLDAEHLHIVTVAAAPTSNESRELLGARTLNRREMSRLMAWAKTGAPVHRGRAKTLSAMVSLLVPATTRSDVFAIPLGSSEGATGVLTLIAREGRIFDANHRAMATALQEPLSAALENDRRLHEMAALREAAEADRSSLLRRLGRTEISDTIVGNETGLRHVMERVELVSRSDVPVLILGETGTGKELVARAIHNRSERSSGPFIRVNCGAIPHELIDSQLFGHERGSFTGANETRQGWFERANGGTLFLDEVGELPLNAQVRFLRVLQDGFVERVGGQNAIHVDVRIVAATHRDLAVMVRETRFREDLWYRIAVFPVLLPPLRERKDDIPDLARHFAQRAAIRFGLAPVEPSKADLRLLAAYHWPGNIRELGAVIDRAAILGDGRSLEIATALGLADKPPHLSTDEPAGNGSATSALKRSTIIPLADAMREHIEAALETTQGRIEGNRGAAALLQINPHTLRARMRKLGITWAAYRE
jgi:transcriptional regulator with GAF, ATPase, and Fis domain